MSNTRRQEQQGPLPAVNEEEMRRAREDAADADPQADERTEGNSTPVIKNN